VGRSISKIIGGNHGGAGHARTFLDLPMIVGRNALARAASR
jgi:hypothetical protein